DGIFVWELATGKKRFQANGSFPTFSPDSSILAYMAEDNSITLWDVATDKLIRKWKSELTNVSVPVFSPDGTRIAAHGRIERQKVLCVWETASGKTVQRIASPRPESNEKIAFSPSGR